MRSMKLSILRLLGLLVVLSVVAAGCSGGTTGGVGNQGGGETPKVSLSGAEFTVGSKEFTEQLILGQIAIQALEARGATVKDETGLPSTGAARRALESGEIDMYWEYTGTGWITHLGHTDPIPDAQEQYEAVAEEDLEKNDIEWLSPAPANNTFALAVRSEAVGILGTRSLSSLGVLSEVRPENVTLCAASEFLNREDGLPGLEKAYGFEIPDDNIVKMEEAQIYKAVDEGDECNYGEVFATDGRVRALDLTLLKDDKDFFPVYNPSLTVNKQVIDENPELAEVFAPITQKLNSEALQDMNVAVDVDGKSEEAVARQFLRENGLL
ncbi:MAG: glycine betaine ABC transporter substrate-binding protein [Rubrobacteraceae bacterium]|nr:glycine betaine ABC transporter substrate-binding protein [Rubrobacteraceae bacterium]